VDSGIPLFELRKTRIYDNSQKDFGFWDVRVREEVAQNLRLSYRQNWFTGDNAYIEYFPNKKGIATAFAPDDHIWHNRVMLACTMSEGNYTIEALHTKDGSLSANIARLNIVCLRNYIFVWNVEKVTDRGREIVFTSKKREECEEAQREIGTSARIVFGKIPEIEALIRKFRGRWVESPEFQDLHRPKVSAMIEEKTKIEKPSVASVGLSLIENVRNMNQAEREELSKLLGLNAPAADPIPQVAIPVPEASAGAVDGGDLASKPFAEVVATAKRIGVKVGRGVKKEDLLEAIKLKLAEPVELTGVSETPAISMDVGNPYDGQNDEEVIEA
jgi:hypothetical protein